MEMQYTRRKATAIIGAGLGAPASIGSARAQNYPSQDVRAVCAFAPGSGADVLARSVVERLRPLMNRTIIVENKPGANGNIACEYVARSKPDGHTILLHAASATASNMYLYKKPPFDAVRDFQLAATINRQPYMVVIAANRPWKNLDELTAHLRERGDKASYGIANPMTAGLGETYKKAFDLKAVQVSYRSGPDGLNDLASGNLDFMTLDPVLAMAQAREGRVRILAASTKDRLSVVPNVPTLHEQGAKDVDIVGWWAAHVPAATPRPIVEQLGKWVTQVIEMPEMREFFAKIGGEPFVNSPDASQRLFVREVDVWKDYIRVAQIEPQ